MLVSKLRSGTSKQWTRTSPPGPTFVLEVPLRNLFTSMCDFVPRDHVTGWCPQRVFSQPLSETNPKKSIFLTLKPYFQAIFPSQIINNISTPPFTTCESKFNLGSRKIYPRLEFYLPCLIITLFFTFFTAKTIMELDHIHTLQFFNTHMETSSIQSKPSPPKYSNVPEKSYRRKYDAFKLLLFFIGNGCCSPEVINSKMDLNLTTLGITYQRRKEKGQIDFVVQNLSSKDHIGFYFDLHHSQWLYLNGERRDSINS